MFLCLHGKLSLNSSFVLIFKINAVAKKKLVGLEQMFAGGEK